MKNKPKNRIKKLASKVLKVGMYRIKIADNKEVEKKVATRQDIKDLYKQGLIKIKQIKGQLSKNVKQRLRKKPRRKGKGSRKGSKNARFDSKKSHMKKIRTLRAYLKQLVLNGNIEKAMKRPLYLKIKGNQFKSKRAFETYLKDMGLLKKPLEEKKEN
ncbi:MAG: 50S ribosomal protein L19e [Candidatus Anstonellales archaeon]